MKEKDLRPGTDQVLESEDGYLVRVLGVAPKGKMYKVERKHRSGSEGRYACVRLSLAELLNAYGAIHSEAGVCNGDPGLLHDVTLEDFTEGRKLASGLYYEAINSLMGLSEASEQDQLGYLERRAEQLVRVIESGLSQMADRWDHLKPMIIELSYPRMWKTALGHKSWEECVQDRFGAVLTRWRDTGVLEQRVLELTTGDDALSNRMTAVIAGTSEWTVRQIKKQAGVIGGTSRGSDSKSRPATRSPVKRPVTDAESAQERPEDARAQLVAPELAEPHDGAAEQPPAPEPVPLREADLRKVVRKFIELDLEPSWLADVASGEDRRSWTDAITNNWPAALARSWPTSTQIHVDGMVIGTLTFTPAPSPLRRSRRRPSS